MVAWAGTFLIAVSFDFASHRSERDNLPGQLWSGGSLVIMFAASSQL